MTPTFHHSIILTALLALGAPLCAADDHAGHDHAAGAHAHAHAEGKPIGSVTIGTQAVAVAAEGAVPLSGEWHLDLTVTPAQPAPQAVRVWVGIENGRGSVKAKAEAEGTTGAYEAHVDVPATLPNGARLWISIDDATGQSAKGALALPATAAAHQEGDGHQH